ncbi:hypothetical protein RSAG8_09152, partial [Rhizoctonia solani AG-8 WAC10335]
MSLVCTTCGNFFREYHLRKLQEKHMSLSLQPPHSNYKHIQSRHVDGSLKKKTPDTRSYVTMNTRSTTGCGTCKARRKKCDETHPKCQACTRLGLDCSGYQYIESTPGKGKKPRTKLDPLQPPIGRGAAASTPSRREPVISNPSGLGSLLDTSTGDSRAGMKTTCTSLDPGSFPTHPLLPASGPSSETPLDIWQPSGGNWCFSSQSCSGLVQSGCDNVTQDLGETHFFSHQSLGSQGGLDSTIDTHTATLHSRTIWKRRNEISSNCAWLPSSHSTPQLESTLDSSCYLEGFLPGEGGEEGDGNDTEVLEQMLYISPVMDSSVEDNFIPFVLQNYAQWCLLVMFEPLEISLLMKQHVTREITSSESSRAWMMLIAKALRPLLKNPRPNQDCEFAVSTMRAEIDQKAICYTLEHFYLEPTIGRQQALKLLGGYLEIIFIQAPTFPLRFLYQLLQDAAFMFRCACPDPAGLPVYLPSRLINPPFSLQYFIALDVATSVTYGRPMLCDYDPGLLELCDQLFQSPHNYSYQWLFGAPGQYILLLARINTLYAHQGVDVAPHFLAQIEQSLSEIRIPLVGSTDPALRVGRMIVQEGWRQAVYIYLYMTLYGANAKDQRVEQARRTFMRLVNETKPGRNPDAFLVIPLMIVCHPHSSRFRHPNTH